MPRFHVPQPLAVDLQLALPAGAARHVQVLRLQPGQCITLFNGQGGEWQARIDRMGRSAVEATVLAPQAVERECDRPVTLAVGLMASERMDWLVEKATELGAAALRPLLAERSSLRLSGERAERKQAHWQAVAVAACEQGGRNRVPPVAPPQPLAAWLRQPPPQHRIARWMLSLDAQAQPLAQVAATLEPATPVWLLSGPEGGLSPAEQAQAQSAGFVPVSLGARVLRAETAPLAALAALTLLG